MSRKQTVLLWLSLFVVASLLGYFDALGSYTAAYSPTTRIHYLKWEVALWWDLAKWNLWVLLSPLVLRLGKRFRIDQRSLLRSIPVYISVGVGVALLHSTLLIIIHFPDTVGLRSFLTYRYFVLMSDFLIGIVICALILASGHALAYYKQARKGELLAAQLQTQLAQAQLQALKMQLHPHFLFNALHSISANLRDTESARSMIARLGDFLRLTLQNAGTQEVSLKQELEFLHCYLDIEQARFRERLTVQVECEPETWDARVPNLILQPNVENAIKHGIAPRREAGRIDVRARRLNGHLQVQIQDNGRGLQNPRGKQNSQNGEALNMAASETFTPGVGLATTRARLERLYPAAHRLEFHNAPEGGLVVTLEVPFETCTSERTNGGQSV